jgi:septum site-determining protein MinD
MVKSIAVVSTGQGTGKTTLALNLGLALHNLNHRVLVFDTDFTKKNMIDHLAIHHLPINMSHVFNGDAHINDAIYKHVSGLRIIPSTIHGYDNFSYHYEDLLGDYDYIVLDTPTQQQHLETVLGNADEAVIIHSPQYSSKIVMDAINTLSKLKVLNLGIVLNHSPEKSTNILFDYPILEKIQTHKDIEKSFQLKNPVLHTHPKSVVSKKFNRLAKRFE